MKTTRISACLLLWLATALGCTTVEYALVSSQPLRNTEGHVIGHTDLLKEDGSGVEFERMTLYVPRLAENGEVIGYEEPVFRGAVLRSLDGRRVGIRQIDLRSRDTNPQNPGVTILIAP